MRRQHREDAKSPIGIAERDVQGGSGRERVGSKTCLAPVIGDPLRDGEVGPSQRLLERFVRPLLRLSINCHVGVRPILSSPLAR